LSQKSPKNIYNQLANINSNTTLESNIKKSTDQHLKHNFESLKLYYLDLIKFQATKPKEQNYKTPSKKNKNKPKEAIIENSPNSSTQKNQTDQDEEIFQFLEKPANKKNSEAEEIENYFSPFKKEEKINYQNSFLNLYSKQELSRIQQKFSELCTNKLQEASQNYFAGRQRNCQQITEK